MTGQRYSTPDGSVWEKVRLAGALVDEFDRVDSPDGAHEEDFRPQSLNEVLTSWGALSLYDPLLTQIDVLTEAFDRVSWFGCNLLIERGGGPKRLIEQLSQTGYEIRKKDSDV